MVFNVSGQLDTNKTDFIEGSDIEKGNLEIPTGDVSIPPPRYRRLTKRSRFCLLLPWFLFIVCFLMLGFSMCWGWSQHKQLRKLMRDRQNDMIIGTDDGPKPSDFDDNRIPYGNDALFADYGPNNEDNGNDVEIREDVFQFLDNDQLKNPSSDDVSSFEVISVSLPRFENLGDFISNFLGNFQFLDTNLKNATIANPL